MAQVVVAKLSGCIPEVKGPIAARFWIEPALVKALLRELGEDD